MAIVKNQVNKQVSALLDVITPTGIRFESKQFYYGEKFQRTLVVIDYPQRVQRIWFSRIATLPGVIVSIHTEPIDSYELVNQMRISMGELGAQMENRTNEITKQRAKDSYDDAKELLRKIDREQQKVKLMTAVLIVTADDQDKLQQRTKRVESLLAAAGMRARTPMFLQEQGLRSAGPWGIIEPEIKQMGARNMPAESVAAAYPFVYSGLNDGRGVLLGTDKGGGIVLVDIWKRGESRTNSNMIIVGKSGMGKSTAVKKILRGEFARGRKIIVIDPENEYGELAEKLGESIDCAGSKNGRINPFQVRYVPLDDDEDSKDKLYDDSSNNAGHLAFHFQTLRTFFKLYLRDITRSEMSRLEMALEAMYEEKGINWSTDPNTIKNEDWPIFEDLYNVLTEMAKEFPNDQVWKELEHKIYPAAKGADAFLWNGPTTLDPQSEFVVLNIHRLLEADADIMRAQFFNILGWTWNKIAKDRLEQILLGVDELYLLADPEIIEALKFLRNTSKRIRKYEGSFLGITQDLVDLTDPSVARFGQPLLNNPSFKIILGQGEKDIEALKKLMTLSEREEQTLTDGNRGEALFLAGNRRLIVKIDVSPEELALFGEGGGR